MVNSHCFTDLKSGTYKFTSLIHMITPCHLHTRITKERRSCYLKSPVISQHLTATSRGRMDSILCKEDYLVTMVTVVVEISEHKEPITLSMRGDYTH